MPLTLKMGRIKAHQTLFRLAKAKAQKVEPLQKVNQEKRKQEKQNPEKKSLMQRRLLALLAVAVIRLCFSFNLFATKSIQLSA